jgi:hypothetical protein
MLDVLDSQFAPKTTRPLAAARDQAVCVDPVERIRDARSSAIQQAGGAGDRHRLQARVHAELGEQVRDVIAHGRRAQ